MTEDLRGAGIRGIPMLGPLDHTVACAPGQSTWLHEQLGLPPQVSCLPRLTPHLKNGASGRQSENFLEGWRKGLLHHTPVLLCPAQRKTKLLEAPAFLPTCPPACREHSLSS